MYHMGIVFLFGWAAFMGYGLFRYNRKSSNDFGKPKLKQNTIKRIVKLSRYTSVQKY